MKINIDNIIKDDNPLIRERSLPVELPLSVEDKSLMEDMISYVKRSTDEELAEKENLRPAVGISAIQVGQAKQMLYVLINDEEGNPFFECALVNPKVLSTSVEKAYLGTGEGCLSVPIDHPGYVYRSRKIKVKAYDYLSDQEVEIKCSGYPAIVLQHELDHLKGILYYDYIDENNPYPVDKDAYCIE